MNKIIIALASFFLINNLLSMEVVQTNQNEVGKKWETNLKTAIAEQNFNSLTSLLKDPLYRTTFKDELNRAFVYSSWKKPEDTSIEMMKIFLKLPEVSINYDDQVYGATTALISATLSGHIKSLKFLLEQPNINVEAKGGNRTALEYVLDFEHTPNREEIIDILTSRHNNSQESFLKQYEENSQELIKAARENDLAKLEHCLKMKPCLYECDNHGKNALQYALLNKNLNMAKKLTFKIDSKKYHSKCAIAASFKECAYNDDLDGIHMLMKSPVNFDTKKSGIQNTLRIACSKKCLVIAQAIINNYFEYIDNLWDMPLVDAVKDNDIDVVKILLSHPIINPWEKTIHNRFLKFYAKKYSNQEMGTILNDAKKKYIKQLEDQKAELEKEL